MEDKERKELYEYAIRIGFIIKSVEDWKENKKYKKLKQYIKQGFRIVDYGEEFKIINILDKNFTKDKGDTIGKLYLWLINSQNTSNQTK